MRFGSQSSAAFALSFYRQKVSREDRDGGWVTCKVFLADVESSLSILQTEFLLFCHLKIYALT